MKITTRNTALFYLILSINLALLPAADRMSYHQGVRFNGLIGSLPAALGRFCAILKADMSIDFGQNFLLLYGPPGNGKTKIAHTVAASLDATIIELVGSNIISSFQNSGSQEIIKQIEQAESLIKEGKRVCLFFDEIDLLASKEAPQNYQDMRNATTTLWKKMDEHRENKNLIFIFATNKKDIIKEQLIERIPSSRHVEIGNPSSIMRSELLQTYYSLRYVPKLNKPKLQGMINQIDTSAKTALDTLIVSIWSQIDLLNSKAQLVYNGSDITASKKIFLSALETFEKDWLRLDTTIKENEAFQQNEAVLQYAHEIGTFITNIKRYTIAPAVLPVQVVAKIVKSTEGFCIRRTLSLLADIIEAQTLNKTTSLPPETIEKICVEAVKKFKQKKPAQSYFSPKTHEALDVASKAASLGSLGLSAYAWYNKSPVKHVTKGARFIIKLKAGV